MLFEYDAVKSASNKVKHGIDFEEAQTLWSDANRVDIPIQYLDEERYMTIGNRNGKFWSAIFTYRKEKIRLISVRRSRKEEIDFYESF